VGWMLDRHWTGALTPAGGRLYPLAAWQAAFALVFAWGLVALLCLALARETHCRQAA